MGGSSSNQEVKVDPKRAPLKNYNNDDDIKLEAQLTGKNKELLAYQRQKTDKTQEFEQMR